MKIYTRNAYKKLLAFSLIAFLSYEIEAAKKDTNAQKASQEQLASNSINRTTDEFNSDMDLLSRSVLAIVIQNLSIVAQVGLVNSSAAQPALTTTLAVVSPFGSEVTTYNTHIATALGLVATAVSSPLAANTAAAITSLDIAIGNFATVITDDSTQLVTSLYSISDINNALAQLSADLSYLHTLQTA